MTEPSSLAATHGALNGDNAEQNLLFRLTDIRWKKPIRRRLVPLLETEAWPELARLLAEPLQSALELQGAGHSSVWKAQAESFLAMLKDPQSWLHACSLAEDFPLFPSAVESAGQLLEQAVEATGRSSRKKDVSEELSRQMELFLQEEQEIFVDDLQPQLAPLFLIRTLSLTLTYCLAAERLEPQWAVRCWELLYSRADQLAQWLDCPQNEAASPLLSLLLRGELCCVLGILFSEVPGLPDLYRMGRKVFGEELDANTDNDGTPHHQLLAILPDWLPACVRQLSLSEAAGRKFWSASAGKRWRQLLERAASLTTSDGQLVLSNGDRIRWKADLTAALTGLAGWKKRGWAVQSVQALQGKRVSRKTGRKFRDCEDESAATQTDWGHLACLRNNWYPGSDLLAVAYEAPQMPLDLVLLATSAMKGIWQTEVRVQGKVVPLTESWSALCWYNHESCDYLELRLQVEGMTIDRQIFLSRTDHVALLADSVSTTGVSAAGEQDSIAVQWELPLGSEWREAKGAQGRERIFKQGPLGLRVLPLSLPQETLTRPDGQLVRQSDGLTLTLQGAGKLCQALLLDWSPERHRKPCDWARLTVTQEREILSPRQAFAVRARIGQHQWVYLRNLEHSGMPRAALGLHSDAETVIAEFQPGGQTEKLVEVHYEDAVNES